MSIDVLVEVDKEEEKNFMRSMRKSELVKYVLLVKVLSQVFIQLLKH
jgi:hypothetical protein